MEHISQLLLYQRLRNRIIELLELHSSFEDIAMLGAFEAVNLVYDWLPLDYEKAPKVFSMKEKEAVTQFLRLLESAADAAEENTWNAQWFKDSSEWSALLNFSRQSHAVFMERGSFSEDAENALLM